MSRRAALRPAPRRLLSLALCLALGAAALGMAGCGKKSPLRLPAAEAGESRRGGGA